MECFDIGKSNHRENIQVSNVTKAIIVFGSSRRDGNTGQAADYLASLLSCDVIDVGAANITPYDYQHRNQDDEFMPIMKRIIEHEIIIFASPIYWYSMSAAWISNGTMHGRKHSVKLACPFTSSHILTTPSSPSSHVHRLHTFSFSLQHQRVLRYKCLLRFICHIFLSVPFFFAPSVV